MIRFGVEAGEILSALLGRKVRFAFSRPDGLEVERADPEQVARYGTTSRVGALIIEIGKGAPEGGFFDAVPIHIITTASLQRVAEHSLAGKPEPVRFRPNIVIDSVGLEAFAENDWEGASMTIGDELNLRVLIPTPRCAVPTLAHGDVGADPRLTLAIAKLNRRQVLDLASMPCLGAYAQVVQPGEIHMGVAPLRALRARTSEPTWPQRAVGEGVKSCPRAGCLMWRRHLCGLRPFGPLLVPRTWF